MEGEGGGGTIRKIFPGDGMTFMVFLYHNEGMIVELFLCYKPHLAQGRAFTHSLKTLY